jgi:hypothetical protein
LPGRVKENYENPKIASLWIGKRTQDFQPGKLPAVLVFYVG